MQGCTTIPTSNHSLFAEIPIHTLHESNLVITAPPISPALKMHTLTTYHFKIHHFDTLPSPWGKIKEATNVN